MQRTILHLDLDAFFCSVEELHDPSLIGKPFAVGGLPEQRGVVSSCSYAARQYGIRSAMPMSRALRLCPQLIVISQHRGNYGEMSDKVMDYLNNLSPSVEQISIDEAFVDISGLGDPASIARTLQADVRINVKLPCSIGIASNKLVAKIATDFGKKQGTSGEPPNALTIVPPGSEAKFLAPLKTEMLWGVGPKTASRLAEHGIRTIGDIASQPEADLVRWFGENSLELWRHARGIDDRPLATDYEAKSISQEHTFAHDIRDDHALEHMLRELAAQVGRRLRREQLAGSTVKIKLRWPDFSSITRQITLAESLDQDDDIYHCALDLLRSVRAKGKAVRLIGVGVSGLKPPIRQLGLWDGNREKQRKLQDVLDNLQSRYGKKAIHRG